MSTVTVSSTPTPKLNAKYVNSDVLGAEITELCGYLYAATYRLLKLIGKFDAEGYWELPGLTSCAHWLNFKCGIGMNAAREKVRVARALPGLPKISAAFERGELSYSKVRAMTRVAHTDNEDYLLMIARHGSAWHMETLIAKYRRASRQIEAAMAEAQHRDRECEFRYDHDGCLVIKARVPAEQGTLIRKALEHAMERRYRDAEPAADELRDAAGEMNRQETIGARRADALADLAETYLAADATTASSADRYQVVVHVSAETLQSQAEVAPTSSPLGIAEFAYLEDGPHVSAETSRRIGCDSRVVKLVEGDDGVPLSIGRKSRSIPPAIRRALQVRDGGCRFPGCTRTRFVDGHHIQHWADGGETSLENLVLLCRQHHRLVHEGGFGCECRPNGRIVFSSPTDEDLSAATQATSITKHQDVIRWFDRYMPDLEIDSDTCVAHWYAGDKMYWDLAVANLFR